MPSPTFKSSASAKITMAITKTKKNTMMTMTKVMLSIQTSFTACTVVPQSLVYWSLLWWRSRWTVDTTGSQHVCGLYMCYRKWNIGLHKISASLSPLIENRRLTEQDALHLLKKQKWESETYKTLNDHHVSVSTRNQAEDTHPLFFICSFCKGDEQKEDEATP